MRWKLFPGTSVSPQESARAFAAIQTAFGLAPRPLRDCLVPTTDFVRLAEARHTAPHPGQPA